MLRAADGYKDLFNYIAVKPRALTEEMIMRMISMRSAEKRQAESHLSREDKLQRALGSECVEACDGKWIKYAKEICRTNGLNAYVVADAFRKAIILGRGKDNNIMIVGEKDRGKSFLVEPLESIFCTFSSPTKGSFSWIGMEGKEVVILNDVQWSEDLLPWADMLRLLDGSTVQFRRPMCSYGSNLVHTREENIAIFATSKDVMRHSSDHRETDMMERRWKVFHLYREIPRDQIDRFCKPCARCFAQFVYLGSE